MIETYERATAADFTKALADCRSMMADLGPKGHTEIHLYADPPDARVPPYLRGLRPSRVIVDGSNWVDVVFLGGHNHLEYRAFAEGVEGEGTRKLTDGLWLRTDME
jgi:hypothetical protein